MAIAVHIADLTEETEGCVRVQRVVESVTAIPNTADAPTIKEFIELEAGDGYLVSAIGKDFITTYLASDVNAA